MAKIRTSARCRACGHTEPRWMGRCPGCGAWGEMVEEAEPNTSAARARRRTGATPRARPISEVPLNHDRRAVTGIGELDRVLGGGFVPGSVTLLGGAPGAGKSTLLLQAAQALAQAGRTVLYISAEESPGQVRLRAERLDALEERLLLASETEIPAVLDLVEASEPDLLVLDSIQTVAHPDVSGTAGGVGQIRECAAAVVSVAKRRGMACVLVGHVTKEGTLAGPRVLEHLVDTVVDFDGDRHHALRLLRASKNRFGAVGEVGCFEMTDRGLTGVADAGRLFLGELGEAGLGTSGVAVTLALEGQRPLACEVQALVAASPLVNPRRVASGLDSQRLSLLLAVLERRADVRLADRDVYVSSVGGLRVTEPAVDLALCVAIASSHSDVAVPRRLIALGEVGLAGEVRLVGKTEQRLAEARRLGFESALLPAAYDGAAHGLELRRVSDLRRALAVAFGG